MQQFGSDRRESGHCADIVDRSKMTHSVTSALSIDALRKLYSITLSAVARRLGRNVKPAGKCPSISWRVG
jgi:hypothetical protein